MTGRFMQLARRAPWALWAVYALLVPRLRRQPDRVYRLLANGAPEHDLRVLARPAIHQMAIDMVLEAFRSGYWGEVHEVMLAARHWVLRLEDISVVVHLWDGDQNSLIPPSHVEYLARAIPNARLHVCRGEGTLLIVDHMEEILQDIVGIAAS